MQVTSHYMEVAAVAPTEWQKELTDLESYH